MNIKKYLVFILLAIISVFTFFIIIKIFETNAFSKGEIELLSNYTSQQFKKIDLEELGVTEEELYNIVGIPNHTRKEYEFVFYELNYKHLHELHAEGRNKDNTCVIFAINLKKHPALKSKITQLK